VVPAGTVPLVILAGFILNVTPPQAIPVIALIIALGFTVITTVNGVPSQMLALGVTV
jgi:hypothetical protein